ncbi:MAG: leucine-rich repeat protein [Ruminococcus sp.]|nr:leucine-rich repeat protein [Ruminococcus sp.]
MRKAVFCIILALVMIFTALPLTAHAAEADLTVSGKWERAGHKDGGTIESANLKWSYDVDDTLYGIVSFEPIDPSKPAVIPDYGIDEYELSTAPWMERGAVSGVYRFTIGEGITKIGKNAFRTAYPFDINYEKSYDIELELPDSLTEIDDYAFYDILIGNVSWGANLKKIGAYAFYYTAIRKVDLPAVEELGEHAFFRTIQTTSVTIGTNLKTIGDGALAFDFEDNAVVYFKGTPEQFNAIDFGTGNDKFLSLNVHVPISGAVTTTVTEGVAVGKKLTCTRMGPAGKLNAVNYRWERSTDKQNWTTIGKSNFYTIQKEDSEQYLRVCIYNGTMTLDGRTFYVDGTLYSTAIKMPEFPICEIRAVLNISKDVDVKIWRRIYINGEQQHRYDGTIADGADKKYTWIPGLYKGNYTLELAPASTYVPRTYEIEVKGEEWLDVELYMYGDVNQNGKVQSNDAMLAYKHAQGEAQDQLTGYALQCADANGNGKVQSNDAMLIYKQAQGEHTLF